MAPFVCKNKAPLTAIIILLAILVGLIDWWLEHETSTFIQWCAFVFAVISLMYIHFIACVDEVEYEEEKYQNDNHPIHSFQERQVEELTDSLTEEQAAEYLNKYGHLDAEGKEMPKELLDKTKNRTVFVLQPIHVTESELEEKLNNNNQIDMETNNNKELPKALQDPKIVNGYSLHNINKKYRSMYGDICQFATVGAKKSEEELMAKVKLYGYPVTVDKPKDGAIAFELACEPKLRIPETGYFGIK